MMRPRFYVLALLVPLLAGCPAITTKEINSTLPQSSPELPRSARAGYQLAARTQQIALGDSRDEVAKLLGRPTDDEAPPPLESGGDSAQAPPLAYLRWVTAEISVYVGFDTTSTVHTIRYYDTNLKDRGPYVRSR